MKVKEHQIVWTDDKISFLWNYYAKNKNLYFTEVFGCEILKKTNLPLNEYHEILDFGCGPGFLLDHLQNACSEWNYTGVDFSKKSIDVLNNKCFHSKMKCKALYTDKLPVNIESKSFDIVFMIEVVEHLDDFRLRDVLNEIYRLLKNNGILVITTPNQEDLSVLTKFCPECGAVFHEKQHVHSWSVGILSEIVMKHGFDSVMMQTLNFGINTLAKKIKKFIRKLVLRQDMTDPHILAIFQKK